MAQCSQHKQEDRDSSPLNARKCQVGRRQRQEMPRANQRETSCMHELWVWLGVPSSEIKVKE